MCMDEVYLYVTMMGISSCGFVQTTSDQKLSLLSGQMSIGEKKLPWHDDELDLRLLLEQGANEHFAAD